MQVNVYCLRHLGLKLGPKEVRAHPRRGQLRIMKHPTGQPVFTASVTDANGEEAVPGLSHVRLVKVDGGLLLAGLECIYSSCADEKWFKQSWWCVPMGGATNHAGLQDRMFAA